MSRDQAIKLAEKLIEKCCITGIRSDAGNFRTIEDARVLVNRLATFIEEETKDLSMKMSDMGEKLKNLEGRMSEEKSADGLQSRRTQNESEEADKNAAQRASQDEAKSKETGRPRTGPLERRELGDPKAGQQ